MSQYTVLMTDHPWPGIEIELDLLGAAGIDLIDAPSSDEDTLAPLARLADVIITCWAPVTRRVIDASESCRAIIRLGVGLDNIDVAHATARGIPVANVPDYCEEEVADHALSFLLAHNRRLIVDHLQGDTTQRPIPWRLSNRTLGLVGYGRIAQELASRARALGMTVLTTHTSRIPRPDSGVEYVASLSELLSRSDVVSLHVPLVDETRHLIGEQALRDMRPEALIINTARGPLIDTEALLQALEHGTIGGAALDVTEPEPLPRDHPLRAHSNVILTPHTAFSSDCSIRDLRERAARAAIAAIGNTPIPNIVNDVALSDLRDG